MAVVHEVLDVQPICAITFSPDCQLNDIYRTLESLYSPVEDGSPVFDFSFTKYYEKEMGPGLKKQFVSFVQTHHPKDLPGLKVRTNEIEKSWSRDGNRCINLDPGYITSAKLVLASAKDFAHRIYLSDGIYGDVQFQFRGHAFRPHPWTFPDYQTETALAFFHRVRERFLEKGKLNGKANTV